jgi:hypothetical protein
LLALEQLATPSHVRAILRSVFAYPSAQGRTDVQAIDRAVIASPATGFAEYSIAAHGNPPGSHLRNAMAAVMVRQRRE